MGNYKQGQHTRKGHMKAIQGVQTSLGFVIITSTLLVTLGTVTANAQYSCAVPPSSLVGWWPANGNANDVINGDTATYSGSYANGEVGQAFNINSAAHTIRVPATCDLNVGNANGMTIEGWVT